VLQRKAKAAVFVKGVEYHAFLDPHRLAEYFFNVDEIHSGRDVGGGQYSGRTADRPRDVSLQVDNGSVGGDVLVLNGPKSSRRAGLPKVTKSTVEAFEQGRVPKKRGKRGKITPEKLLEIKRINGREWPP
jgi:hypothetical protein